MSIFSHPHISLLFFAVVTLSPSKFLWGSSEHHRSLKKLLQWFLLSVQVSCHCVCNVCAALVCWTRCNLPMAAVFFLNTSQPQHHVLLWLNNVSAIKSSFFSYFAPACLFTCTENQKTHLHFIKTSLPEKSNYGFWNKWIWHMDIVIASRK